MTRIDIYFGDLTPEKQLEIIKGVGNNCGFDIHPICTIEIEEEYEIVKN